MGCTASTMAPNRAGGPLQAAMPTGGVPERKKSILKIESPAEESVIADRWAETLSAAKTGIEQASDISRFSKEIKAVGRDELEQLVVAFGKRLQNKHRDEVRVSNKRNKSISSRKTGVERSSTKRGSILTGLAELYSDGQGVLSQEPKVSTQEVITATDLNRRLIKEIMRTDFDESKLRVIIDQHVTKSWAMLEDTYPAAAELSPHVNETCLLPFACTVLLRGLAAFSRRLINDTSLIERDVKTAMGRLRWLQTSVYSMVKCECVILYVVSNGAVRVICDDTLIDGAKFPIADSKLLLKASKGRRLPLLLNREQTTSFKDPLLLKSKLNIFSSCLVTYSNFVSDQVELVVQCINKQAPKRRNLRATMAVTAAQQERYSRVDLKPGRDRGRASTSSNAKSTASLVSELFSSKDTKALSLLLQMGGANQQVGGLQARREALISVLQVIEQETQNSDTGLVIEKIVEAAYKLVDVERISVFTVDHEKVGKELLLKVCKDIEIRGMRMSIQDGIVGKSASDACVIVVDDAETSEWFNNTMDEASGFHTRTLMTIPFKDDDGKVVSIIELINKKEGVFTKEDQSIMESFGVMSGTLIKSAQLRDQLLVAERKTAALMHVSQASEAASQIKGQDKEKVGLVLAAVVENIKNLICADRITFFVIDQLGAKLFCLYGSQAMHGTAIPLAKGICGDVATHGRIERVDDVLNDPRFVPCSDSKNTYVTKTMLVGTVKDHQSRPIAIIQAINKTVEECVVPFRDTDEELLQAFCIGISTILQRHATSMLLTRLGRTETDGMLDYYGANGGGGDEASAHPSEEQMEAHAAAQATQFLALAHTVTLHSIDEPRLHELYRLFLSPTLEFDVFDASSDELIHVVMMLFTQYQSVRLAGVSEEKIHAFLLRIRLAYKDHPFHNWYHGVSVFHVAWHLLQAFQAQREGYFGQTDSFAILIAALTHDADHPANSNQLEIDSGSPLARAHNDQSVLENHHLVCTFDIILHKDVQLLENIDRKQVSFVRRRIISAVLATDMKHHFDMCKKLDGIGAVAELSESDADKDFITKAIVHTSDLSAQVFPTALATQWEDRVSKEFMEEARTREELQLMVPEFMRGLADDQVRAKRQVGFLDFIVTPLWSSMARLLPNALSSCLHNLKENRNYYLAVADGTIHYPPPTADLPTMRPIDDEKHYVEELMTSTTFSTMPGKGFDEDNKATTTTATSAGN